MALMNHSRADGGFRFRVSDSVEIPLRGHLLRLRLLDGRPSVAELAVGRKLRIVSPSGQEREVTIMGHPVTAGKQTQQRLERTREMDVVVSREDAGSGDSLIGIGWMASGPVRERGDAR
jgi:hypothetical protein